MPIEYSNDYLLDKQVKILQPINGYRASSDAVLLSAMVCSCEHKVRILDVGSGTGAISLCLAQRLQNNTVDICGIELQPELVELSQMSAKANNFSFLHYYQGDIRQKLKDEALRACSFDIVVTNPPYAHKDMPSPNDSKAAAHNLQQMDLSDWMAFCLKMAKPFGKIYVINRAEALPKICVSLSGKAGGITVLPIYSKSAQSAKRVIVTAQKDSKAPCKILPPFMVHDNDGKYTAQAQQILRQGTDFSEVLEMI